MLHKNSILLELISTFKYLRIIFLTLKYQIVGDVTKGSTLAPENFKGVRKVINAVSVIVGPKEGDTPERAKYSQVCLLMPKIIIFSFNLCQY